MLPKKFREWIKNFWECTLYFRENILVFLLFNLVILWNVIKCKTYFIKNNPQSAMHIICLISDAILQKCHPYYKTFPLQFSYCKNEFILCKDNKKKKTQIFHGTSFQWLYVKSIYSCYRWISIVFIRALKDNRVWREAKINVKWLIQMLNRT